MGREPPDLTGRAPADGASQPIGAHLARRQEAVFERFGLERGEVGPLSASDLTPPHGLFRTHLAEGLMLYRRPATRRTSTGSSARG